MDANSPKSLVKKARTSKALPKYFASCRQAQIACLSLPTPWEVLAYTLPSPCLYLADFL